MPTSMATVLLSLASNSLHWGLISSDLGPLAGRLVHPTAPVLLTKSGPLGTRIRPARLQDQASRTSYPFKV